MCFGIYHTAPNISLNLLPPDIHFQTSLLFTLVDIIAHVNIVESNLAVPSSKSESRDQLVNLEG